MILIDMTYKDKAFLEVEVVLELKMNEGSC
jgi:hypothetical protein